MEDQGYAVVDREAKRYLYTPAKVTNHMTPIERRTQE